MSSCHSSSQPWNCDKQLKLQRAAPRCTLHHPYNYHSSPTPFCSRPPSKSTRNSEVNTQNLKLVLSMEFVIRSSKTWTIFFFFFFLTDLNTWHSETYIDSGNILILNLKGLSSWSPRNAQATCGTGDNQCSKRALGQNGDMQLRKNGRRQSGLLLPEI